MMKTFLECKYLKTMVRSLLEMYSALKVIQHSLVTIYEFTNDLLKVEVSPWLVLFVSIMFVNVYLLKNDEKCFLFHLKSSFR